MPEVVVLTLANICLDLAIYVCTFLDPSDILALRMTCRFLEYTTRQREVWEAALRRVCIVGDLFLPSFPISEMSREQLEKAATAPHHDRTGSMWIEFCRSVKKRVMPVGGDLFVVPGGRYLVEFSMLQRMISVFDLGHTSTTNPTPIASVGVQVGADGWTTLVVQATPDGMGLSIFLSDVHKACTIYEFYPQGANCSLTEVARLTYDFSIGLRNRVLLNMTTVVWYEFYRDRMDFWVWDYRLNHSIYFQVDVELSGYFDYPEVIVTKTAVIVLCEEKVLIWAIPHLLPQPPTLHHPSVPWDPSATYTPPLLTLPFPQHNNLRLVGWKIMLPWYSSSSNPIFFEKQYASIVHKFEIRLKPDLSSAGLHFVGEEKFDGGEVSWDTLGA